MSFRGALAELRGTKKPRSDESPPPLVLQAHSIPPERGERDLLKAYENMPWLHAVLLKIAFSVSSLTWRLHVAQSGGAAVRHRGVQRAGADSRRTILNGLRKAGETKEIVEHPLLDLLAEGNPLMRGNGPLWLTQTHLDLAGEALWLLDRNGVGVPGRIWPIPPHWIMETPTAKKPAYTIQSARGSQRVTVPEEDAIAFRRLKPEDPYGRGAGTARALSDELETDEFAAQHAKIWFHNRAIPPAIVSLTAGKAGQGTVSQPEIDKISIAWRHAAQGLQNAWRTMFLSHEVKVQEMSQTFENMQLIPLRKFERDTIIQVFGMPPEMLGIIEKSNRATITAADFLFNSNVVVPRAEFLRSVLQATLVNMFDDRLILDYDSPVKEDHEHKLAVMTESPAVRIDEWREAAGQPPLGDGSGDGFMVKNDVSYVADLRTVTAATPTAGAPAAARAVTKQLATGDIDRVVNAISPEPMIDALLPEITSTVEHFGQIGVDEALPLVEEQSAAKADGIDVAFDLERPGISDFLTTESADRVKDLIDPTTRQAVREALRDGVAAGEGQAEIAARVEAVFDQADAVRALNIARTEVTRASNYGNWQGQIQAGLEHRRWITAGDGDVRTVHVAMESLGAVPINEPFQAGGFSAMHPGAFGNVAQDAQCRCRTIGARNVRDANSDAQRRFERAQAPFVRLLTRAARTGFDAQRKAVLAELKRQAA